MIAFLIKFYLTNCHFKVFFSDSVSLLISYFSNRKHQIKVSSLISSWIVIQEGVSQGLFLGPLLFKYFMTDIFSISLNRAQYNYTEDNTLSFWSPDFDKIISTLEVEFKQLIDWFKFNKMQAYYPDKFQVLAVDKKNFEKSPSMHLQSIILHHFILKLLNRNKRQIEIQLTSLHKVIYIKA